MSTNSIADRIRANRKSRSPVQDTVEQHFDQITDAVTQRISFRAIHAQLTREGHNAGRGHSSLFAAYKAVKMRRGNASAPVPAASRALPDAIIDGRRNTTNWE